MTNSELTVSLSQSLDDLEDRLGRLPGLLIRVQRADGGAVQGEVLDVASTHLLLLDTATRKQVEVAASDVRAIDVQLPRRGREWSLAVSAVVGFTAALVGFTRLPWLSADGTGAMIGFVAISALTAGVYAIPMVRTRLDAWLTRWQRLYSDPSLRSG